MADVSALRPSEYIFPEMLPLCEVAQHPERRYVLSSPTDRSLEEYSDAYGFDLARLTGSLVLDVGAGVHARFAHEADEHGVRVIPLNPAWGYGQYYRQPPGPGKQADALPADRVAGQAEHLPFQDDSFDFVFSLWGVPAYLPGTAEAHTRAYREIRRVLKVGGIALLYPVMAIMKNDPRFHHVLAEATMGDYQLLTQGVPPKLLIHKQTDTTNPELLRAVIADCDRQTAAYIW